MNEVRQSIINDLTHILGPAFPIALCDEVPALPASKTIRNMRSLAQIPQECFIREGSRVLIVTKPFLEWFGSRLRSDKQLA